MTRRTSTVPSVPGADIPTFKEQGVDVELVNRRAVMAQENLKAAGAKALDIDLYLPSDRFAVFLEGERTRIAGVLTGLGLVK